MSKAADVTDSTWDTAVLQSETPVLVDFWAEWCGPCKAMGPYVDKLADEAAGKLKVVKLNTQDNLEVPGRYGITAIPTFLLIKKGEVVHQIVGSQPYEKFKQAILSKI
ncbi:MAG: thioredoxin [Planctomycetes bacterium]|nr:thioredoxin [Planctomycetota bacterium]